VKDLKTRGGQEKGEAFFGGFVEGEPERRESPEEQRDPDLS
jgi:hypothetical protein